MAEITLRTTFRIKRGTSQAWSKVNPILAYGEPGFEKDTNKLKIGDGSKRWNNLSYVNEFVLGDDGKSVTYEDNTLSLYGYNSAEVGQFPIKGQNNLEWVDQASSITDEDIESICVRKG